MISRNDLLLGLLVVFIWAANIVAIRVFVGEVEPITALALRFSATALVFLPFIKWPSRDKIWHVAQISLLLCVLHQSTLFWGLGVLEASVTSIIIQTQVIFSVLLGALFFGEKIGWRTIAGVVTGLSGVVILMGLPDQPPALDGSIAILLSALFVAMAYARMKGLEGVSPLSYIGIIHVVCAPIVVVMAFTMEQPFDMDWGAVNWFIVAPIIAYQVIVLSVSHMLWQTLMQRNSMGVLPALCLLIPVFAVILSYLFLQERIDAVMMLGGCMTIAGVGVIMLRQFQKHKSLHEDEIF